MLNCIYFLLLSTVIQAAILRIWFDSTLFHPVQVYLESRREEQGWVGFLVKLATCYQCFGTWVGFIVVLGLAWFLPNAPFGPLNVPCVFMFGVATGMLSELYDLFVISKLRS